ncbi:unnamed protein product [Prunus armeniaca]|uniref:Uncharacterized protein n=1 Tax=Prunus armeniaca TaxID=36596 RepID=A0A6J5XE18_PRUAR|nr:unnamed protein product [Prunus armeniaca]
MDRLTLCPFLNGFTFCPILIGSGYGSCPPYLPSQQYFISFRVRSPNRFAVSPDKTNRNCSSPEVKQRMNVQQAFLNSIRNDFNQNQSRCTVIGAFLNRYSFSGFALDGYCSGHLLFQQGEPPREVTFALIGKGLEVLIEISMKSKKSTIDEPTRILVMMKFIKVFHPTLGSPQERMVLQPQGPWNTKAAIASWKDYMKEIYRHVDSDYTSSLVVELLRFHRNLYQHYIHVKCRKCGGVRVIIEEVGADNLKFTAKVVCNTIAVTVATYYSTIHWRQHKMKQTGNLSEWIGLGSLASGDHPFDPHTELLKTGGVLVLVGFPSEVKISCQTQYLPVLLSLHLCSETLWLMQETMSTCSLSQGQTLLLVAFDFKPSGGHPTGRFTNGRTISDIVGFENANEPCCGGYFPPFICFKSSGTNRSSALCTDRLKYVFWFAYHPAEAANMIIAKGLLDGDGSVSYPINIRELYNYNS